MESKGMADCWHCDAKDAGVHLIQLGLPTWQLSKKVYVCEKCFDGPDGYRGHAGVHYIGRVERVGLVQFYGEV